MDQADKDAAVEAAFKTYEKGRTIEDEKGQRRTRPYAEQRALWEAMWVAADFSWAGLADAAWERGTEANAAQMLKRWEAPADFPGGVPGKREGDAELKAATLQEYWRWVPNEGWSEGQGWSGGRLASDTELAELGLLVSINGQLWHVIHRPEFGASVASDNLMDDGEPRPDLALPSEQSEPKRTATALALAGAVLRRLALGKVGSQASLQGARAQRLDAVWRAFAGSTKTKRTLHLFAPLAAFDNSDASGLSFGNEVTFYNAAFGEKASFNSATFVEHADFSYATFGDSASFSYATFGGTADFTFATFGRSASFHSAAFGDSAAFAVAIFEHLADFQSATFGDDAWFISTTFLDNADFISATFGDNAVFEAATFGDSAIFRRVEFGDNASFDYTRFGDNASFSYATFGDKASFDEATFNGGIRFDAATFAGKLTASNLICKGRFQMRATEVKGYVDFSGARWPEKHENQHAAFEGCRFRDVANFKTGDFAAFALFDGAEFNSRVLFTDSGDAAADRLFLAAQSAAADAVSADAALVKVQLDYECALRCWTRTEQHKPEGERNPEPIKPEDMFPEERGPDARFGALAGGFRTLKLAMAAQSDTNREQRFYRYELRTRAKRPSEPKAAKFTARVYGWASDYGASISRPLIGLVIVLVGFAPIYLAMGVGLGLVVRPPNAGSIWQALELSLVNIFRPLSALTEEGYRADTLGYLLLKHSDLTALIVRVLAILQSLSALLLAFLFGLAVRRRFQMT